MSDIKIISEQTPSSKSYEKYFFNPISRILFDANWIMIRWGINYSARKKDDLIIINP
jgi:hypothetical protein